MSGWSAVVFGLLIAMGVRAGCNSPNGVAVTVSITAPTSNQKLVMTDKDTTFSTLTAQSSGDDDNKLSWTFSGFVFPSGALGNKGTSVSVTPPRAMARGQLVLGRKDG